MNLLHVLSAGGGRDHFSAQQLGVGVGPGRLIPEELLVWKTFHTRHLRVPASISPSRTFSL